MKAFQLKSTVDYMSYWKDYPKNAQKRLQQLRTIIIDTAEKSEVVDTLEETLKWGEVSYVTKKGSTIRLDWKQKAPNQVALYFNCNTKLIPTFRMVFPKTFNYEGSRAIVLSMEASLPKKELKSCVKAALQYHKVKHLSDLGIELNT